MLSFSFAILRRLRGNASAGHEAQRHHHPAARERRRPSRERHHQARHVDTHTPQHCEHVTAVSCVSQWRIASSSIATGTSALAHSFETARALSANRGDTAHRTGRPAQARHTHTHTHHKLLSHTHTSLSNAEASSVPLEALYLFSTRCAPRPEAHAAARLSEGASIVHLSHHQFGRRSAGAAPQRPLAGAKLLPLSADLSLSLSLCL